MAPLWSLPTITANCYLLDAEGRVARIVPFGFPLEHVSTQILELLGPGQSKGVAASRGRVVVIP